VIQVRGLTRTYHGRAGEPDQVILRNVDLDIAGGTMVALIGRSGSGKTTLLSILGGLDDGFSGSVRIDGLELAGLDDSALSRLRATTIGMVFQTAQHIAYLTCLDNVCLPALFADNDQGRPARRTPPWSAVRARARELLETVGLSGLEARRPGKLSGGQQQRLGIARALLNRPSLLLCDEITGNLDPITGAGVIELLTELNQAHQVTVLMATHDTQVAASADSVLVIEDGRVRAGQVPVGATS